MLHWLRPLPDFAKADEAVARQRCVVEIARTEHLNLPQVLVGKGGVRLRVPVVPRVGGYSVDTLLGPRPAHLLLLGLRWRCLGCRRLGSCLRRWHRGGTHLGCLWARLRLPLLPTLLLLFSLPGQLLAPQPLDLLALLLRLARAPLGLLFARAHVLILLEEPPALLLAQKSKLQGLIIVQCVQVAQPEPLMQQVEGYPVVGRTRRIHHRLLQVDHAGALRDPEVMAPTLLLVVKDDFHSNELRWLSSGGLRWLALTVVLHRRPPGGRSSSAQPRTALAPSSDPSSAQSAPPALENVAPHRSARGWGN
mmetsp:Transcript_12740/g.34957  ORF Transcript_12740/g.34957 Transcript_12740/m.34957 type:complete len:307 (-) Transcript_12740:58-978(-)